jgi:hypothetical protein
MPVSPRTFFVLSALLAASLAWCAAPTVPANDPFTQAPNTWAKRSPLPSGPTSPRMGYESSWGYHPSRRVLIRWAGHNQGGGGEQNAETWTFDPASARWTLLEPNDSPPGVCCAQQNVFDIAHSRFVRFPSFSGSHGWQWSREIALKNSSVWTYDLDKNTWRDMRPVPEPRVSPLRCASYDTDHHVIVVFGGENNSEGTLVYDPHNNTWTRLQPPDQPAFRSGGNMAYDEARKLHVLFGSQFTNDPHTWAFDLKANRWIDLKPKRQPPTDRNDAVLTYDPLNKVILAVVRVTEGKGDKAKSHLETWALDTGKRTWTKMNPPREPDVSGNRARLLTFLPDRNLAVLENRTHPPPGPAEQQIWTYRYAEPASRDASQRLALNLRMAKDRIEVSWERLASVKAPIRYVILRGEGEAPWKAEFRRIATVAGSANSYEDRNVKRGTVYHYLVQGEDAKGRTQSVSDRVRGQPGLVEDVVASVLSEKEVELRWQAPVDKDVTGYHVERAIVEVWTEDQLPREKQRTPPLKAPSVSALHRIGPFTVLTSEPVKAPCRIDKVDLSKPKQVEGKPLLERRLAKDQIDPKGKPYGRAVFAYRVRAVNALGVRSGPSPYVLTIPSAPQQVFSRERETKCDLKWAANPEQKLRGYRVYRMDGRWTKQPIVRLTEEPIARTTFTDNEAGKASRRYHIIAVDALGQEGIPSAPVWFEREWKSFYKPFVKEWHQ